MSVPRGVWVLGVVSLLMDTSSGMTRSLLPVFLTTTLGATALWVGVLEGVTEALGLMNSSAITSLFVIEDGVPVGILHIHDCLRAGVA